MISNDRYMQFTLSQPEASTTQRMTGIGCLGAEYNLNCQNNDGKAGHYEG